MEKKLTKAEIKAIEEKQNQKRTLRDRVIRALRDYERDIEATKRYYQINGMTDKIMYGGGLIPEEKEKLLRRYDCLDFLKVYENYTKEERDEAKDYTWSFVRLMWNTEDEDESCGDGRRLQAYIERDDLWNDEIIWSKAQVKLYLQLATKFGYKRILYTNSSSGALANITDFVDFGAKVVGTCGKKGYKEKAGVILDITEVNIEEEQ